MTFTLVEKKDAPGMDAYCSFFSKNPYIPITLFCFFFFLSSFFFFSFYFFGSSVFSSIFYDCRKNVREEREREREKEKSTNLLLRCLLSFSDSLVLSTVFLNRIFCICIFHCLLREWQTDFRRTIYTYIYIRVLNRKNMLLSNQSKFKAISFFFLLLANDV